MHIENHSAYTPPLYRAHTAQQTSNNTTTATDDETTATSTRGSTSPTNAMMGSAGNRLSPKTVQYMIQLQIKEGQVPDTPEDIQQHYADLRKEHFHRIATDSDYAAKQAQLLGKSQDGLLIPNDVFKAYAASGRGDELGYALNDPNNPVLKVQKQRIALYEREVAQGVPPAQIFTDILKFNLNLPDSYTDGELDRTNSYPPGYYKSLQRSDLDMLGTAMAQATGSKAAKTDAGQASTPTPSESQETSAADTAKAAAVTGTTGSRLSAETAGYVIEASQQADGAAAKATLPISVQHGLDDIANDPAYAAKSAELWASGPVLLVFDGPPEMNSSSRELNSAASKRMDTILAGLEAARKQRETLYNSKIDEGLPPAQINAEILALNASQIEHNARVDKLQGDPIGTRTNMFKAQHDYLQQAIAKANSTKAAG